MGFYTNASPPSGSPYQDGLLLAKTDGKWAAAQAPVPPDTAPGPVYVLDSVSCPTSAFCVATGYDEPGTGAQGIILTWSGGTWPAIQAPLPVNAATGQQDAAVTAVSCPTSSSCTAAGMHETGAGDPATMILTRSGGQWAAAQAPLPANAATGTSASGTSANPALDDLSCLATSFCMAVGDYTDTSGSQDGMLLTNAGGSWVASQAPTPGNAASGPEEHLWHVSCPSASFCMATGTYNQPSLSTGMILDWSAGKWTAEQATLPGQSSASTLVGVSGVSCTSASWCILTGVNQGYPGSTIILTRSGSTWTAAQPQSPPNANGGISGLADVSCAAPASCTAVGQYLDTAQDLEGVTDTWSG